MTKNTEIVPDDVDEMFAEAGQVDPTGENDPFAGMDDLLDSVVEDDAEGWVPKERGEGIMGIVIKVSETRSDFSDEMCPTVTLRTKDDVKYRVVGYGAVLKRELNDQNPEPGDLIAVKYWGEKPIKNGKFAGRPYKHFGVVVRKAAKSA